MSGFLHRPLNDDEISTYAGSNLLSNLRFELDHHNHTIDQDDDWAVRDSITQYRQACIFEATEQDRAVTSESFMETLGYCEKGTTLLDRQRNKTLYATVKLNLDPPSKSSSGVSLM